MTSRLNDQRCVACEGGVPALQPELREQYRAELSADWQLNADQTALKARFSFRNFHETMAFVNAVAWIAHRENHHPDLQVSYRAVTVLWTTHATGNITLNDMICAAKVDALLAATTNEVSL